MGVAFHLKTFNMPTSLKYPYANYSLRTIPKSMFCAWVDDAHCPLKTSIMVIIINWILQPKMFLKNDKNYEDYFLNVHWLTVRNKMYSFIFISRETCCFSHTIIDQIKQMRFEKWIEIKFIIICRDQNKNSHANI